MYVVKGKCLQVSNLCNLNETRLYFTRCMRIQFNLMILFLYLRHWCSWWMFSQAKFNIITPKCSAALTVKALSTSLWGRSNVGRIFLISSAPAMTRHTYENFHGWSFSTYSCQSCMHLVNMFGFLCMLNFWGGNDSGHDRVVHSWWGSWLGSWLCTW